MTGKSLTVAAIALAMLLSAPTADAQRHNGASRGKEKTEHTQKSNNSSRPGRTDRGNSGSTNRNQKTRPSSQKKKDDKAATRPGRNQKPSGNHNNNGNNNRPNNNGYRPGNTNPGGTHKPAIRPNRPHVRPPHNQAPNHRPAPAPAPKPTPNRHPIASRPHAPRPPMIVPPVRPYRPPVRPWRRPTPPPVWRPWHGPSLAGILGLTFGTAIGVSLDYLYGNNYFVDGYSNDVVYLRNVNEMNYVWPDATLYYGPSGLTGSQFSFSTTYRDMTRYNNLYMQLVNRYGRPVGYSSVGGAFDATWFGPNNGFIRLQFNAMNPGSGTRFYTTLEFGN